MFSALAWTCQPALITPSASPSCTESHAGFHSPHLAIGFKPVASMRRYASRLLWITEAGTQLLLETRNVFLDTLDKAAAGGEGWIPEVNPEFTIVPSSGLLQIHSHGLIGFHSRQEHFQG